MELVAGKNIDIKTWDSAIAKSPVENIFLYSWYLDAVCDEWYALVTADYKTILPVPFTKKAGYKQLIQAPFTREYDIIGDEFTWHEAIAFLSREFKSIHFRSSTPDVISGGRERRHQWIDLREDFEKNYSTNAKRILKKTGSFSVETGQHPEVLLDLFVTNVVHKIDTISKQDLIRLSLLMNAALKQKCGELITIKKESEIVASGFFLLDKKRVTYLKGAATEEAKKEGAMYLVIDYALKKYKNCFETFDFGGSDISNVAEFYHKFGAHDRVYYDYHVNDLPFWFKALKRLKRK